MVLFINASLSSHSPLLGEREKEREAVAHGQGRMFAVSLSISLSLSVSISLPFYLPSLLSPSLLFLSLFFLPDKTLINWQNIYACSMAQRKQ